MMGASGALFLARAFRDGACQNLQVCILGWSTYCCNHSFIRGEFTKLKKHAQKPFYINH